VNKTTPIINIIGDLDTYADELDGEGWHNAASGIREAAMQIGHQRILICTLLARLGEMVALMQGDIDFGKVTAGDTRKMLMKQARELLS
jgi:hypothetical protein